jgi:hypothetical protein
VPESTLFFLAASIQVGEKLRQYLLRIENLWEVSLNFNCLKVIFGGNFVFLFKFALQTEVDVIKSRRYRG